MAILRNREVEILRTAIEIDGSTFQVRYPDGETELVKMNELEFTKSEYDQFVKQELPVVKMVDETPAETKEQPADKLKTASLSSKG